MRMASALALAMTRALATTMAAPSEPTNLVLIKPSLGRNCHRRNINTSNFVGGFMDYHGRSKAVCVPFIDDPDLEGEPAGKRNWVPKGKEVHAQMVKNGTEQNIYSGNELVVTYAKRGSLVDARQVFDKMHETNVFSWTAMITGYARGGYYKEALSLFYQMQRAGIRLDDFIFPSVLKACASLVALRQGQEIHAYIVVRGFEADVFTGSALIDMYAKCGRVRCARQVFDKMSQRSVVSWNAAIAAYANIGQSDEALKLLCEMHLEGMKPSVVTVVIALPVCANLGALQQGREIHSHAIRSGTECDVFVGSALVDMYAKCNIIEDARRVFEKMPQRNIVSWNAMIAGYAGSGHAEEALKLFHQMQLEGVKPDLITWTVIIAAYVDNGHGDEGLKLFQRMQLSGIKPNVVSWTAIITGYAHNGHCSEALKYFRQMQLAGLKPDVISWNAMIAGYTQNEHWDEALQFFRQMQTEDLKANTVTIASVLPACANLAALQQGKEVHAYVVRNGFNSDAFVGSALLDMYAKCGIIEHAHCVFDKMPQKNVVLWNAMITGYAMHGQGEHALNLFYQMQQECMKPDHITFIGVLSACSHTGLLDEGRQYFDCMSRDHHITPSLEHYACMVDLLGRAGHLDEAYALISKMTFKPDICVWGALLGACRIHCNIELGQRVAEHIFELEPENTACYVLLSNIHAVVGRWDGVAKVRRMMKDRGLRKSPGCSWIEIKNRVHVFLVGDTSHPQKERIYAILDCLARQMEVAGYVPDTNFILHDV